MGVDNPVRLAALHDRVEPLHQPARGEHGIGRPERAVRGDVAAPLQAVAAGVGAHGRVEVDAVGVVLVHALGRGGDHQVLPRPLAAGVVGHLRVHARQAVDRVGPLGPPIGHSHSHAAQVAAARLDPQPQSRRCRRPLGRLGRRRRNRPIPPDPPLPAHLARTPLSGRANDPQAQTPAIALAACSLSRTPGKGLFLRRHYGWTIEVTFENVKQLLGFEDPANRKEKAVRRTAPMALLLYSLIVAWFHQEGHRHLKFPDRPWYSHQEEPSFVDMLTTLRRQSLEETQAESGELCATACLLGTLRPKASLHCLRVSRTLRYPASSAVAQVEHFQALPQAVAHVRCSSAFSLRRNTARPASENRTLEKEDYPNHPYPLPGRLSAARIASARRFQPPPTRPLDNSGPSDQPEHLWHVWKTRAKPAPSLRALL